MTFKQGDHVLTPDGHVGVIVRVDKSEWRDRSERISRLHRYYVESPESGSPVVWWLANQLIKEGTPQAGEYRKAFEAYLTQGAGELSDEQKEILGDGRGMNALANTLLEALRDEERGIHSSLFRPIADNWMFLRQRSAMAFRSLDILLAKGMIETPKFTRRFVRLTDKARYPSEGQRQNEQPAG